MYCKHCGREIDDNSSYCKYCGKAQDNRVSTSNGTVNDTIVENWGHSRGWKQSPLTQRAC